MVVAIDGLGLKDYSTFFGCVFDVQMRTALERDHIFSWLFLLFFARFFFFFFLSNIAG